MQKRSLTRRVTSDLTNMKQKFVKNLEYNIKAITFERNGYFIYISGVLLIVWCNFNDLYLILLLSTHIYYQK